MHILLIEDEAPKRMHIRSLLERIRPEDTVEDARSVRSAIDAMRRRTPDLVILDVSLPTFDVTAHEPGGRPQGFGGVEVMRYMDRYDIESPVIAVTQYEAFAADGREVALGALGAELKAAHPVTYRGIVYFNSVLGGWNDELEALIAKVVDEKRGEA